VEWNSLREEWKEGLTQEWSGTHSGKSGKRDSLNRGGAQPDRRNS